MHQMQHGIEESGNQVNQSRRAYRTAFTQLRDVQVTGKTVALAKPLKFSTSLRVLIELSRLGVMTGDSADGKDLQVDLLRVPIKWVTSLPP